MGTDGSGLGVTCDHCSSSRILLRRMSEAGSEAGFEAPTRVAEHVNLTTNSNEIIFTKSPLHISTTMLDFTDVGHKANLILT